MSPMAPARERIGRPPWTVRPRLSACITRSIQATGTPHRRDASRV
ncbi:hypothetical protein ABIC78_002605 [Novosphingobium sp. 1529]